MAKTPAPKFPVSDLSALSLDDLSQLHQTVGKHLEERKAARIKELHAELITLGQTVHIGPSDAGKKPKGKPAPKDKAASAEGNGKTRAKPPVTHRGPGGETWTSRGAKPRWLAALIAEGKNPDDYKV